MASSSTYNPPCAACKFLRRKCMPGSCIFSPYFPPEDPQRFANVHKVFGASNVAKLLKHVLPDQRRETVNSLAYEAEARIRDPVHGCVGAISYLQRQVDRLQEELDAAHADLFLFACNNIPVQPSAPQVPVGSMPMQKVIAGSYNGGGGDDGGRLHQTPSLPISYHDPSNYIYNNDDGWMELYQSMMGFRE